MKTPTHPPHISAREWRRAALFAAFVIALVLLPYALGWGAQTEEMRFSGALIAADDIHSYLGKMRLGARGIWDFYLFYTPEPHDAVPGVFLPYLAAGQLVGLFYDDADPALTPALIIAYHAMRVLFTLLLILVLYRIIAHFLRSPSQRMTALILSTLGGGFGWLLLFVPGGDGWLGSLPPDLFIPEGFGFLIPLALPHLALARALLLLGFLALFTAINGSSGSTKYALLAALCWALVGIIVPFYLAVIYCLLAAWAIGLIVRMRYARTRQCEASLWDASSLQRHRVVRQWSLARVFAGGGQFDPVIRLIVYGGIAAGLTLPLFAYYALAFAGNPAFAAWSAQNLLPAPHPLQYLVAYSLFIVPGAFAVRWAWRRGRQRGAYILLIAWALAGLVLVYLPINVQRRMSEAIIVPLAILAAHGLALLLRRHVRRRMRPPLRAAFLLIASLTSATLLLTTVLGARSTAPPLFIPGAQIAAFTWLNANAPPDARILASMRTGNLLPAYTHLRPYVGHGPETLGALAKAAETERFYSDLMRADERAALVGSVDMGYVFYGESERALAQNADASAPAWAEALTLVYDAEGVRIYRLP